MRKKLSEDLVFYFDPLYPKNFSKYTNGEIAILGIGGNLGNVRRRFRKLAIYLASHPHVRLLRTAPVLKNPPFGYFDQPDFYNSVIIVQTSFSPRELLHFCLQTEKRFRRKRSFKNAPRTLDIDILFYGKKRVDQKDLTIPHPHWSERDSVQLPLQYLLEGLCGL
ncbi:MULTISPECIES: 2-amino-4-hydroxy-6-hydroxymethyldihydropteridine diphosphokinase [unclassified Nitratiruptor]|uniref:2-amino-4-hydroxy-6- hydroxymethyldihydropteridine diphosphokinase n=1 Tax=unclassified Nitratiruptor TaxID=2624044 RepID=UPI0019150E1B|nr:MULTISPECIES: 2-amino-4-hydroxy-6-hydroxymethyldihydropteridine diphosphokinase [unclassified Nitratiruptor]BCD59772.1 2-amino-4-hydroxy-6-hydroxymethyldihydropteridine diphosphokinase [Nitratiruptor sp. YY08-10]BCD63696.1 2-amino-4-hydroxy-6-hydroxymethyldihydropteridine diphosphokinase [Nitratiruptor sp. YY08-14]